MANFELLKIKIQDIKVCFEKLNLIAKIYWIIPSKLWNSTTIIILIQKADKDSKVRAQDIVKLSNELDRANMDRDGLKNAKAKLEDELKSYKVDLEALKKRLHEVEQENRKLAHDREELARAYKDTDALKVRLEQRVQVRKHKT